jgi:ABC-type nitrate/sulfonate/bicarbonate transport system substrate-binding protein
MSRSEVGSYLEVDIARRQFLRAGLLGAGTLGLMACGGAAPAAVASPGAPVTFQFAFQNTSSAALQLIAAADGFFEKENIDWQLVPTTGATGTLVAGIVSGSIDGYLTTLTTAITTRQAGTDLVLLGGLITSPTAIGVPSRDRTTPVATGTAASGYGATIRALAGKTIGVQGLTNASVYELEYLAKQSKLPPNSFKYVLVPSGGPAIAALQAGTVDAVSQALLSIEQAVELGYGRQVFTFRNDPPALQLGHLVGCLTSRSFLAAHPDFEARYQRAITKAVGVFNDAKQRSHVIDVLAAQKITFTGGVDGAKYLSEVPVFATLSRATLTSAVDFLFSSGIVPATPTVPPTDTVVSAAITKP